MESANNLVAQLLRRQEVFLLAANSYSGTQAERGDGFKPPASWVLRNIGAIS